jgi:spermidine/putrescine transport system permease protein
MKAQRPRAWSDTLLDGYTALFVVYMLLPLLVMAAAAFNASATPSVVDWRGVTLDWFWRLGHDARLLQGLLNSALIAAGVVILSVPLGLAGALLLDRLEGRSAGLLGAIMVSPILTPGIILGVSTLVFWRDLGLGGGLLVAILAQSSFVASYAMLLFSARLARFDHALADAALDLGASHGLVLRRILLPFLAPAIASAAVVSVLQSFENYNTTVFSIGGEWTLVTEIGSRLRFGLSPVVNAIGVIFVLLTIAAALAYVALKERRAEA